MASALADPEYTTQEVIDFLEATLPSASNRDASRKKAFVRFRDFLRVPPLKGIFDDDVQVLFKGNKPPPPPPGSKSTSSPGGVEGLLSRCGDKSHDGTKDEGFKRTARDAMECVAWLLFRARTAEDTEVPLSATDFSSAPPIAPTDLTVQSPGDHPRNIFYATFTSLPASCYKSMRLCDHLKDWPNGDKLRQGSKALACTFVYVLLSARLPTSRAAPKAVGLGGVVDGSTTPKNGDDDDGAGKPLELPDLLPEPDAQRFFRLWLESRENLRREEAAKAGSKDAEKVSPVVSYILIGTFQSSSSSSSSGPASASDPQSDSSNPFANMDNDKDKASKVKTPEEEEEEDRIADKIGHQLGLYTAAAGLAGAPETWDQSECRQLLEAREAAKKLREAAAKSRKAREEAAKASAALAASASAPGAPPGANPQGKRDDSFADAVAEAAAASLLGDDDEGTLLSASSAKKYHQDLEAARERAQQKEVEEERRRQLTRDPLGIRPATFDLRQLQNTRNRMQGRNPRADFGIVDRNTSEQKREEIMSRRAQLISSSMNTGVGREPSSKDLEGEGHQALVSATANAALSCGGSVLPTDPDFDPLLFLTIVHGKVQHTPLLEALERLNSVADDQADRLKGMVKDNFSLFARCADGMDWYADNFEVGNIPGASAQQNCPPPAQKNPKEGGYSKSSKKGPKKLDYLKAATVTSRLARLTDYSNAGQEQAKEAFKPLLDKTASIRAHKNAMTKLRHIAGVLSVPAAMREHLDHGRVAEAVNAYRGVRFIDERCGVEILRSAKAKALEVAEDARKALTKILSDEGATTGQLIVAVRDMIDLDELDQGSASKSSGEGKPPSVEKIENPALLCLMEQSKHFKTTTESTVKRFEAAIAEAIKKDQVKNASGTVDGGGASNSSVSSALVDDSMMGADSGIGPMSLSSPTGKRFYLNEEEDWGVNGGGGAGGHDGRHGDGGGDGLDGEGGAVNPLTSDVNALRVSAIAKVQSLIKMWLPRLIRIATTAFEREETLKASSDAEKYEVRVAVDGTFDEKRTVESVLNREVADALVIMLRIAGECALGVVDEENIRPRSLVTPTTPYGRKEGLFGVVKDLSGHASGTLKGSVTKAVAAAVATGPVGLFSIACSSKMEKQLPAAQCGKCSRTLSLISEYVKSCVATHSMFVAGASSARKTGWLGDDGGDDLVGGRGGGGIADWGLQGKGPQGTFACLRVHRLVPPPVRQDVVRSGPRALREELLAS